MLISTHTTPPISRLVYFARAAPEWPLGETATEKHTESTRFLSSTASYVKVVNTTLPRKGRKYDGFRRVYGGFT